MRLGKFIEATGDLRQRQGLPDVGKRLFVLKLDTSNHCNLRCKHCGVHLIRDRVNPVTMSTEMLNRLADEVFPYCNEVCFGSMAEPWMSPVTEDALILGRARRVPLRQVVTNALLLNERRARLLIDMQLDLVSVSLDAATRETYASIRGADLGKVIRNVERLRDLKDQLGSNLPRIRFSFVMLRSNLHEMPDMVDLAHGLGASLVDFTMPFIDSRLDLDEELPARDPDLWVAMMERARSRMEALGLPTGHLPDVRGALAAHGTATAGRKAALEPDEGGTPLCMAPWSYLSITPAGDVYPCCSPYVLGGPPLENLGENTLAKILTGPIHGDLRRSLVTGPLRDDCARCKATDFLSPCHLNEGYYLDAGPRLPRAEM